MTASARIGVLGVGDELMGDGGIGPLVLKTLEARYEIPPNVLLHDLGTPGPGIASFLADYDAIILIDTMSAKGRLTDGRGYSKRHLDRGPFLRCVSPHDPALVEALLFAEFSGKGPREVLLLSVIPEATEMGCTPAEELWAAVVPAMSAVLAELHRLGVDVRARAHEAVPSIWWEEKLVLESEPAET